METINCAPILKKGDILLRLPIQEDIAAREKLGAAVEYLKMCGRDIHSADRFDHEDAVKWYEQIIRHPCKWIIVYQDHCIGIAGLRPYPDDNKARYSIEIYDSNMYGRGIGTKVTKLILDYAFNSLNYHKVYLRVLDYNIRAIRCYEKCGFIKEGFDREGALINGIYCSDIYMGILKNEFTHH